MLNASEVYDLCLTVPLPKGYFWDVVPVSENTIDVDIRKQKKIKFFSSYVTGMIVNNTAKPAPTRDSILDAINILKIQEFSL